MKPRRQQRAETRNGEIGSVVVCMSMDRREGARERRAGGRVYGRAAGWELNLEFEGVLVFGEGMDAVVIEKVCKLLDLFLGEIVNQKMLG